MNTFLQEILPGLKNSPKKLHSKYFYDEAGDKIFQQIMHCEEYYLTDCEMEIFKTQTPELAKELKNGFDKFDLIELGAGDASKSIHLLSQLTKNDVDFTYYPIDISSHIIDELEKELPQKIPSLKIKGLNGEYFDMLDKAYKLSDRRKAVLFMGANIGNMPIEEAEAFCRKLRKKLSPEDLVLIGFDLKKNPEMIRNAYSDSEGYTREFNLNLLRRINRELKADFQTENFEHYATYDPETGACKSYLISLKDQDVHIGKEKVHFDKDEYIFMEISQKYNLEEIEAMAVSTGFKPVKHFFDKQKRFVDSVWQCV